MLPSSPSTPLPRISLRFVAHFCIFSRSILVLGLSSRSLLVFFLWRVAAHAVQVHSTRLLGISIDAALDPHLVACAGAMPGRSLPLIPLSPTYPFARLFAVDVAFFPTFRFVF